MKCFLGIDFGTSGIKAVVIGENGEMFGVGYKEISLITPQPMWVEQDPNEWWDAAIYAIKEDVSKSGHGKDVCAVALTGQMLGSTLLDKNLNSLGNCMIWLD